MRSIGRNTIATLEASYPLPYFQDDTGVAVTHWHRLIELATHRAHSRGYAIGTRLVERLANLLRLLSGFVEQPGPAELDQHPLGTGGYQ